MSNTLTDVLKRAALDHVIDRLPAEPAVLELKPRNLADLKTWLGIPNGLVAADRPENMVRSVDGSRLPDSEFRYEELSPDQQKAVHDQAYNLLFNDVSAEMEKSPKIQAVISHMMKTATPLPALVGQNLTVNNGEVYSITTPTATFDTVTINGTGQIQLGQDTKLTCNTLIYNP